LIYLEIFSRLLLNSGDGKNKNPRPKDVVLLKTPHRGARDVNGILEFNSHVTFPTPLETGAATPVSSTFRVAQCHGCP